MGDIIGNLFGMGQETKYDKLAAQQALTGFNWLTGDNGITGYVNNGNAANSQIAALLGLGGDTAAAKSAFNNYLNSTGYQTNLASGSNAITSNSASRGLLNSGATGKALTSFGQNLGSNYFNNYLGQLTGVSNSGLNAAGQIGQAGTTGGGNAAGYTQSIGNAQAQGWGNIFGDLFGSGGGAGSLAQFFI